ncbi:BMC domain-containing protein [Brevibacillus laterosporus]|uniref:BMC domain-containing protein n=1 Tax=Brevibacillus laterosporus TaxID=1465 RepID=A0AAP8QCR1_BRELA|nr:BMC domain-containing protein [Brevibacillus laterosporus]MED1665941.1 BMC domain-containing protein [Brevibacillus laterosporus]MED1667342.1 BMC domain-containing protein [Brevibacillus laterosporus]MED1717234.1 BMC domain-containing protein [Brevibacillus laterosporus]PPA87242.1 BMC domain-containing protein [Brevibacillus laterosporus]PPB02125.1 BMC domain-containing protein [Brevibacillus laterosporus]
MKNQALGLVETKGLLGAMEAADAALKAANVTFIGFERLKKDGLVTVKVTGDVGAVQAAVEAGSAAARQLNCLFNSHVIARLHEETAKIVTVDSPKETPKKTPKELPAKNIQSTPLEVITEAKKPEAAPVVDHVEEVSVQLTENAQEETQDENDVVIQEQQLEEATSLVSSAKKKEKRLEDMKLAELRKIAYKLKLTTISKVQVKYAKKDQLIKAIAQHEGEKE